MFDSDDSNAEEGGLQINKRFARRFDELNKLKDLQRAKDLGLQDEGDGSLDSEDEESEDDDAEFLTTSLDLQIVKTINSIRKKDPKIYQKDNVWFEGDDENNEQDSDEDNDENDDKSGSKPKRFKDVLREQLLSKGADIENSDSHNKHNNETKRKNKLVYDQEQEKIRKEFLQTIADNDNDNDNDSDRSDEMTLQVKKKSNAESLKEREELQKVLAEMTKLGNKSKAKSSNSTSEGQNADEFLSDYILKEKWKSGYSIKVRDDDDDKSDDNAVDLDEDEEELDKMENFESKYNFRFEELQDAGDSNAVGGLKDIQVVGHARNVQGSVRKEDEKRKQERERRKERKEREKRVKEAEIKRLKNLKRQELTSRLEKINQIGGINENIGINIDELDEEWDPVKHEEMMQKQFGVEYYNEEDNIEPKDEEENILEEIENDRENYGSIEEPEDGGVGTVTALLKANKRNQKRSKKGRKQSSEYFEDDDFEHDETTQEEFDKLNEELYKLDYEDVVGGIPCRFKYRHVEAQDYGLTAEDILNAEDNELNQFLSLKKLSPYNFNAVREEKLSKKRKRLRSAIKERTNTIVACTKSNETIDTATRDSQPTASSNEEVKKKRKRRKKSSDDGADTTPVPLAVIKHSKLNEKGNKKKKEGGKSSKEKDKERRLGLYK